MKIVDLQTFLALPAGTLFCKYAPTYLSELMIKGESLPPRDFCYQDIAMTAAGPENNAADTLARIEATGEDAPLDLDCQGRDGCFEDGQLFAVWSPNDVRSLIARLNQALKDSGAA